MKMTCFDSRSTMTSMVVKPEEEGSCSMKSIEMEFHGQLKTDNLFEHPIGSVMQCLSLGTGCAGLDVVLYVGMDAWPGIFTTNKFKGAVLTKVSQ